MAIRLDKELERERDLLAKARGSNRSALVREAIVQYLEDNEDIRLAEEALSTMRSTKALQQVRRELGLDG